MKKSLILLLILYSSLGIAQEQFKLDFSLVRTYDGNSLGDWISAKNTFVFNSNSNGDIVQYAADGSKIKYQKVGNTILGEEEEHKYQMITVLGEDGTEYEIKVFDEVDYGVIFYFTTSYVFMAFNNPE